MGFVYFSIPVVCGYYIMQYAIGEAKKNIGEEGDKLKQKYQEQGSAIKDEVKHRNKYMEDLVDKTLKKNKSKPPDENQSQQR